jgi:glycine/D-amino acid oxidase-like deaminating enzyme
MTVPQVDTLIIGQGLAGSILAFQLIARGQRVLVIDNDHQGSASQVAAGIINPITGHRLNLTEGFVDYYACATAFYAELESTLRVSLIKQVEQVRLLKNPGQASYFSKRLEQDAYADFLETNTATTLFKEQPYGSAKIKQTSIVNTSELLAALKRWLIEQNAHLNTHVDYDELHFNSSGVSYREFSASRVIFCEGYQAINNPWLKDLPFKLAKGEILTIEKPKEKLREEPGEQLRAKQGEKQGEEQTQMLSWGNWLIPYGDNCAKLGSNYAWQDTDLTPSHSVREKLLNSLEEQTGLKPTVLNHQVGIRPTTTHRHAFVGGISKQAGAYCFNGFGSKGCLTIPAHSQLLCDHLINNTQLPEELNKWL